MKLAEYIKSVGLSHNQFAQEARISQSIVSRVCRGGGCSAQTALRIIRATEYMVTLEGLVTTGNPWSEWGGEGSAEGTTALQGAHERPASSEDESSR